MNKCPDCGSKMEYIDKKEYGKDISGKGRYNIRYYLCKQCNKRWRYNTATGMWR